MSNYSAVLALFKEVECGDSARIAQLARWGGELPAAASNPSSPRKRAKTAGSAAPAEPTLQRTLTPSTEQVGAFRARFAEVRAREPGTPVKDVAARVLLEFKLAAAQALHQGEVAEEACARQRRVAAFIARCSAVDDATRSRWARLPQHLVSGETNPAWLAARRHRVTGSAVAALAGVSPYESRAQRMEAMLLSAKAREDATAAGSARGEAAREAMAWGSAHEADAAAAFLCYARTHLVGRTRAARELADVQLVSAGLLLSREEGRAFEAYSPDGVVVERWRGANATSGKPSWGVVKSLVEYKCPARLRPPRAAAPAAVPAKAASAAAPPRTVPRHFFPLEAPPPPSLSSLSAAQRADAKPVPPNYYAQVQWGMGLLNLQRCFFVTWMSSDGVAFDAGAPAPARRAAEAHWTAHEIARDVDAAARDANERGAPLVRILHGAADADAVASRGVVVRTPYGCVEITVVPFDHTVRLICAPRRRVVAPDCFVCSRTLLNAIPSPLAPIPVKSVLQRRPRAPGAPVVAA